MRLILPILALILLLVSFSTSSGVRYYPDIENAEIEQLKPKLRDILDWAYEWTEERDIDLVLTSIIRTEKRNNELGAESKTHVEGRAVDFSIKSKWGWNKELLDEFKDDIVKKWGKYGAISYSDGKRRLLIYHNVGHGDHGHIQIAR